MSETRKGEKAKRRRTKVASPEEVPKDTKVKMELVAPPEEAPKEKQLYTMGTWRGMRQWKCKLCPWDTLEGEAKMLEHIASAHKPPPSPILIADKGGRQIN